MSCPFCSRKATVINENWNLIQDAYPVSFGHHLLIPKRHVKRLEELQGIEWASLGDALEVAMYFLQNHLTDFKDFNIGLNNGKEAGQTIDHVHFHLIPRKEGDVENPRGGVRGVIPSKKEY